MAIRWVYTYTKLYCINVLRHTLFMVTSKQIDDFFGDVTDDVSPHNLHILFSLGFTTSTKRPAVWVDISGNSLHMMLKKKGHLPKINLCQVAAIQPDEGYVGYIHGFVRVNAKKSWWFWWRCHCFYTTGKRQSAISEAQWSDVHVPGWLGRLWTGWQQWKTRCFRHVQTVCIGTMVHESGIPRQGA